MPTRRRSARLPLPPGFGAIWSTVALDLVGFGIVLPLLPIYSERFGASPTTIGLLVASFSVAQLLLAPVWGRVSDRVGRKPVLILSLVGTAVGSLLTGLAGGLALLFVGRLIDGASGASVSVAQAAVTDVAAPEQRARLLGLLGAAFGVGFIGGPALGALAALAGRRLPFLLAAGVAGLNAVWALRRLPETHPGHEPDPEAWTHARAGGRLAPWLAVAFLSLVSFSGFEAVFALFGERRLGLHLASTAGVFVAVGVVHALVQVGLVHPAVERFGEIGALRAGLALHALGMVLLALAHGFVLAGPALALLTAGQGLVTPTMAATISARSPARGRGEALGWQQSAGGLARVVGPAVAGLVFQHAGVPVPFLAGAGFVSVAVIVATRESRLAQVTVQ